MNESYAIERIRELEVVNDLLQTSLEEREEENKVLRAQVQALMNSQYVDYAAIG